MKLKQIVLSSLMVSACGESTSDWATSGGEPVVTWESYRASAVPHRGGFIVEGDILLSTEERLRKYYESTYGRRGALGRRAQRSRRRALAGR